MKSEENIASKTEKGNESGTNKTKKNLPYITKTNKNQNLGLKEKKTLNSSSIPLSKKSKENKIEVGQDYNEDSIKEIKEKKIFNSLFVPLSTKAKGNKTNEKETGKDYNNELNNPIDSNEDNKKDYADSNMEESKEPKEKENVISNTKQISSSNDKARKFNEKVFALKSQERTKTNKFKKGGGAKQTTLKKENSNKLNGMKGQPNNTNETRTALGSEKTNVEVEDKGHKEEKEPQINGEIEAKSHTEEKEPQTGDAKVTKPWLLWRGGQPGYWELNRTTVGLRS